MNKNNLVIGFRKPIAMLFPSSALQRLDGTLGLKACISTMITYREFTTKSMRSKEMNSLCTVFGIDVSKKSLSVCLLSSEKEEYFTVPNNVKSFDSFLKKIDYLDLSNAKFVMEATGIYHLRIAKQLAERNYDVRVLNPLIIKRYTQMQMSRIKTDKTDSFMIARYASTLLEQYGKFKLRTNVQYKIELMLKAIDDLNKQNTMLNNQIKALNCYPFADSQIKSCYKRLVSHIDRTISKLEKQTKEILKKEFPNTYNLLKTIPGIGIRMNAIIISMLSSFKEFSNAKKAASFLGICPSPHESGSSVRGKGSISKKGSSYIRKMLFMCALSAVRYNRPCKNMYLRLKAKGKTWKQIAIAVANKLIRQAFGVLKSGLAFDANFVEKRFEKSCKSA